MTQTQGEIPYKFSIYVCMVISYSRIWNNPHTSTVCVYVCMYVCVFVFPFILDIRFVGRTAGVTQEEGHTGFLIHLPSAVRALFFLARRIQPLLSLVDREVELC